VLGKFTGQDQSNSGDDVSGCWAMRSTGETYEVWISRDEMVDFLLYAASLLASVATRSKMSLTNELRMLMARLEMPVSGWTCLSTVKTRQQTLRNPCQKATGTAKLTLVDVGRVRLLPGLGALLLVTGGRGSLLASLLLLGRRFSSRGLAAGGGSLLCFGRHCWRCECGGQCRVEVAKLGVMELVEACDGSGEMDGRSSTAGERATYGERAACCDLAGARWPERAVAAGRGWLSEASVISNSLRAGAAALNRRRASPPG
jgi:hypothetical protein